MQFTYQALTIFLTSLLLNTAAAHSCDTSVAWADSTDCHYFYQCLPGVEPARKKCGAGTAFNPVIQACDYQQNVPACYKEPHHPHPHHE
ncbi:chitin binding peritrophin-A domain-containing protein [Aspergillus ibericus CBS 121593]|uniref:Chitin binding domain protein Peritrophin-A n=1 Tax=Aspergillus ibericus CBS 121593 TaxID=1448316 RepID=A0A395HB09_9EURO|nr:chitin binding domain protein Peritrophin-A [Aspergillus ibericus CBS 121593]RAL04836.1 chitin binding domain protein Peritrophin-A [Aspergillus ibericus CBS 121593]